MNGKKEIYGVYSPEGDMTFIMEDTYDANGEPLSSECVGWYHGEPSDEDNVTFKGKLKAEYLIDNEPREGAKAPEEKKDTYVVVGEYLDGRKVTCLDPLKHPASYPMEFSTEKEAADFATELNGRIDEDVKQFFPVYRAEKVGEGKINVGDSVVVQSGKHGPDLVGRSGKVISIDENEPNGPYFIDGNSFLLHFFGHELIKEGEQ